MFRLLKVSKTGVKAGVKNVYCVGLGLVGVSVGLSNLGLGGTMMHQSWESDRLIHPLPLAVLTLSYASAAKAAMYGLGWPISAACFATANDKPRFIRRMSLPQYVLNQQ
jgi:hypothetical protein